MADQLLTPPPNRAYGAIELEQADEEQILDQNTTDQGAVRANDAMNLLLPILFMFFLLFCAAVVYFIYMILLFGGWSGCAPFHPPHPTSNWNRFKNQSFAVGIDLTAGYGTAAILFNNGTIFNVARIEGSSKYNEVMARASLKSSSHPSPPYFNCGKREIRDVYRQWSRFFRRINGFPASNEVAGLADVLEKLRLEINAFLGPLGHLETAYITVPYLPALYLEDLVDAAYYTNFVALTSRTGLFYTSGDNGAYTFSEINTALASNGLCYDPSNYTISDANDKPRDTSTPCHIWSENILAVLYTRNALGAHVSPIPDARYMFAALGNTNFNLGSSHSDESGYWLEVRLALRAGIRSYYGRGNILGRVVSFGESANIEIFDAILKDEVQAAQEFKDNPDKKPIFWRKDPIFAAARGAAMFANRCTQLADPYCFPDLTPVHLWW